MGERKTSERLSVTAPKGFLAGTARCGLKKAGDDLAMMFSERPAVAVAVFTQNLVQAAPVLVSREHCGSRPIVQSSSIRAARTHARAREGRVTPARPPKWSRSISTATTAKYWSPRQA